MRRMEDLAVSPWRKWSEQAVLEVVRAEFEREIQGYMGWNAQALISFLNMLGFNLSGMILF